MRRIFGKRRLVFLAALVIAGAAAVGGYAWFSATGSGSGTATVGTSTAFQISGTTSGTLYPGSSETVSFSVTNPGSGSEELGTISLSGIKACSGASSTWDTGTGSCSNSGTEVTACEDFSNTASSTTADFSMADVVENQELSAGTTYDSGSGSNPALTKATGTLAMNDLASSQDNCKNVSLYLEFTS